MWWLQLPDNMSSENLHCHFWVKNPTMTWHLLSCMAVS